MATHSSVLAWRIPGTGEPGGLPSMGSHRVGHDWSDLAAAALITRFQETGKASESSFYHRNQEREKGKWSHSVMSNSSWSHGLQPTRLLCPWIFQARVLEWGAIAFSAMEYYSSIKKNEIMPLAATWMDLEIVILSEITQDRERQISYDITYMWNLKNWYK